MDELTIILTFSLTIFIVGGFYTLIQISARMDDVAKFVLTHPRPYLMNITSGNKTLLSYGDWNNGVAVIVNNGKISFIKYSEKTRVGAK